MNEQEFLAQTRQIMTDERDMTVIIKIAQAWTIMAALQLAYRHPGLEEPMKAGLRQVGNLFGEAVISLHPEAGPLMEAGWDPSMDIDEDGTQIGDVDADLGDDVEHDIYGNGPDSDYYEDEEDDDDDDY